MFKYFISYEKYEINRCIRGKCCNSPQVGSGECQWHFGRSEYTDIGVSSLVFCVDGDEGMTSVGCIPV